MIPIEAGAKDNEDESYGVGEAETEPEELYKAIPFHDAETEKRVTEVRVVDGGATETDDSWAVEIVISRGADEKQVMENAVGSSGTRAAGVALLQRRRVSMTL